MSFDTSTQKQGTIPQIGRFEGGSYTFVTAEVSGATLSLPTKLKHINGGFGTTEDGLTCFATVGETSNGIVTFTRCGVYSDLTTPTLHYVLFGH